MLVIPLGIMMGGCMKAPGKAPKGATKKQQAVLISEWPLRGREWIRISLSRYQGRDEVSLRTWMIKENGEKYPSRQGINIPVKHVSNLAKGFARAERKAKMLNLI
jgi:hypothetical protein